MAVLDPIAVKSGKIVPKAGDVVNGFAYVSGDPTVNDSYQPASGEAYLTSIPRDRANRARAVLLGHAPYPSTSRTNKFNQQLVDDVLAAEPNFDATAYKRRTDMIADFTTKNTAKLIQALNQAPLHAQSLADAYDHLHNWPIGGGIGHTINDFANSASAVLNSKTQAAQGAFNEVQPAVSDELATVYKGGPATIPDIQAQEKAFGSGLPPAESSSALGEAARLMKDRLDTLVQRWQNGMGSQAGTYPLIGGKANTGFPVISPHAADAIKSLYSRYNSPAAGGKSGSGFTNGQVYKDANGNRAMYQDGQWVPHP